MDRTAMHLRAMTQFVRSEPFKFWYESRTGKPVERFLRGYVDDQPRLGEAPLPAAARLMAINEGIREIMFGRRYGEYYEALRRGWAKSLEQGATGSRKRRLAQSLATPAWVNPAHIAAVYEKCAEMSAQTGEPHHVDHIVPLQSPVVCGLHVPWNLQVIPARENARKYNSFSDEQDRSIPAVA